MNQPKFKFGDKVFPKDGLPFIVCDIRRDAECDYIYTGDCASIHHAEYDLQLYSEPLKKKLYAFSGRNKDDDRIQFRKSEEYTSSDYMLVREPGYDIEYPGAK